MTRLAAALVAIVLAACGSPLPSPTPTPPASASPSPGTTPTAATSPPTASPLEHATGWSNLLLSMTVYGWMFPLTVVEPAQFSLYGDGHVIYVVEHGLIGEPTASYELLQAQLTDSQVDDLLRDALGAGGLATARAQYVTTVSDATTTAFEVHAGGYDKTVSVHALEDIDVGGPVDPPDAADRAMFLHLANRLKGFAAAVSAGEFVDQGGYVPLAYRATLNRARIKPNADWPWSDLVPHDFEVAQDGTLTANVTRSQAAAVVALDETQLLIARSPDGVAYRIQLRPLLPQETAMMLR